MQSVNSANSVPERLSAVVDPPAGPPLLVEVDQRGRVLGIRVTRDGDRLPSWPQVEALGRQALVKAWEIGEDFGGWPALAVVLSEPDEPRVVTDGELVTVWRYAVKAGAPVDEVAAALGLTTRRLQARLSALRHEGHDLPKAKRGPRTDERNAR